MTTYEIALQRISDAIANRATELDLSGLGMTMIPENIGECRSLSILRLNNNQLTTLPQAINHLNELKILHLHHNLIGQVPTQIGEYKHLIELRLDHNQVSNIPRTFRQLTALKHLNLSHNRLHLLPAYFDTFNRLETLYVAANNLNKLPDCIGKLPRLQRLDLAQNHIGFLPAEIGSLPKLQYLSLQNNQINHIAAEIGNLYCLQHLNLSGNLLASLPASVAQLKNLQNDPANGIIGLDLSGNRFHIPDEVYQQTPAEIIQYILDLQASRYLRPLHEAKLIFIGWGSVGKTSLINALMSGTGTFSPEQQKTDGIDIKTWRVKRGKDRIKLNVWDFGGQEIMHATHKFFMSARSAYVIVVDSRADDAYGELGIEYWLKLIRSYAGEVPIVVALNKCDQHKLEIPHLALRAKYPHIVTFVKTSCASHIGIEELRQAVEQAIAQLPHIDDVLPESYFTIKNKLELLPNDYLSYEAYLDICRKIDPEFGEVSSQSLMHLLHDLGIMFNFRDEHTSALHLQVLKPEWVTNGVYQIITAPLLGQRRGILNSSEIARILDAKEYPNNVVRSYIMQLMLRFELCFQMTDSLETYFIPAAFPQDQPNNLQWQYAAADLLRFQYRYDVMPGTIMSRFIVKVHHRIKDHYYWRNGVILTYGNALAFIRADNADRKIFIEVSGKNGKRELLSFIHAMFDLIHIGLSDINSIAYIPIDEAGKITLRYSEVLHFINSGVTERPVEGIEGMINLLALIGDYVPPPPANGSYPIDTIAPVNHLPNPILPIIEQPILNKWYSAIWIRVVSALAFLGLLSQVADSQFLRHIWQWLTQ